MIGYLVCYLQGYVDVFRNLRIGFLVCFKVDVWMMKSGAYFGM